MSVDKAIDDPFARPPSGDGAAAVPGISSQAADAALVRSLLREASFATLATLDPATGGESTGRPYASLVEVATSVDGLPLLLLSRLARHTRNIVADQRVSLLVDRRQTSVRPLEEPRASVLGRLQVNASAEARDRFLRRHPEAGVYADFGDFQFWSLQMESAHLIAGFGRIRTVAAADLEFDGADAASSTLTRALMREEMNIIARLNGETEGGAPGRAWDRVVGLDSEGVDVAGKGIVIRLPLPSQAIDLETYIASVRRILLAGP